MVVGGRSACPIRTTRRYACAVGVRREERHFQDAARGSAPASFRRVIRRQSRPSLPPVTARLRFGRGAGFIGHLAERHRPGGSGRARSGLSPMFDDTCHERLCALPEVYVAARRAERPSAIASKDERRPVDRSGCSERPSRTVCTRSRAWPCEQHLVFPRCCCHGERPFGSAHSACRDRPGRDAAREPRW